MEHNGNALVAMAESLGRTPCVGAAGTYVAEGLVVKVACGSGWNAECVATDGWIR